MRTRRAAEMPPRLRRIGSRDESGAMIVTLNSARVSGQPTWFAAARRATLGIVNRARKAWAAARSRASWRVRSAAVDRAARSRARRGREGVHSRRVGRNGEPARRSSTQTCAFPGGCWKPPSHVSDSSSTDTYSRRRGAVQSPFAVVPSKKHLSEWCRLLSRREADGWPKSGARLRAPMTAAEVHEVRIPTAGERARIAQPQQQRISSMSPTGGATSGDRAEAVSG